MRTTKILSLSLLLLLGCDESTTPDAGGGTDAGAMIDSGPGDVDSGPGDVDSGPDDVDSGPGDTDAGPGMDAGPDFDAGFDGGSDAGVSCAADLDPQDDGSGASGGVGVPDLVISELAPGMFIEIFNTTADPIEIALTTFQLCSPFTYVALSDIAPTLIIGAGAYATLPWPAGFTDSAAGGEVILYANTAFSNPGAMLDFICWGTNPHDTRRTLAGTAGKWRLTCAPPLTMGSISRNVMTEGTTLADYDVTSAPSPLDCTP